VAIVGVDVSEDRATVIADGIVAECVTRCR